MTKQILIGTLILNSALLVGQPPPPAQPQSQSTTLTGSISQFNYGPDGRIAGFVMAPNTLVNLPPDWAMQVEMLAKPGNSARVLGAVTTNAAGMQIVQPQSLEVAGKTLSLNPPSQPAPYAGSGTIRALNYGRGGEVNGFILQNGIIARTQPFGMSDLSVIKPGANISLSGFARSTPSGRTVVEVQSITANGQTIAMNMAPAAGPGRGGPKGKRGRGGPPAPPAAGAPAPPPAAGAPAPPPPPAAGAPAPPPPPAAGAPAP